MNFEQPDGVSSRSRGSVPNRNIAKSRNEQSRFISAEYADMFSSLPDADPGKVDCGVSNLRDNLVEPRDALFLSQPKAEQSARRRAITTRRARRQGQRQLPFRAHHAGAVVALVVLVWGAISAGRGPGGPDRLDVYPVIGELRYEGQPASGATIFLHPQDPSIPVRPQAFVNDDGTFEVTTYQPGDGAPAGRYKATIEWRRAVAGQSADESVPPNVFPAAYTSPQSSPVEVTVDEGENTFAPIDIPK